MAALREGAEEEGSEEEAVDKEAAVDWVTEHLDSAAAMTTPWSPAHCHCTQFETACSVLAPLAAQGMSRRSSPRRST